MMPRRRHPHADERRPVSAVHQTDDLPMFQEPAPSQPRRGSEASADRLDASGRLPSMKLRTLQRLARGPVTASDWHADVQRLKGREVPVNSVAPRLTELTKPGPNGQPYAVYDDSVENVSKYGAPNCPYRITTTGLQLLREIEAKRHTAGGSFEHLKEIRP